MDSKCKIVTKKSGYPLYLPRILAILRATNANDFLHTFRISYGKARYGRPNRDRRLSGLLF
ncbi:TPA: hypothetical protein ACSP31_003957, partial [Aeromonas veronii]